jgi:hypothetical protein
MRCEYLRRLSVVIAVALGKSETYFLLFFILLDWEQAFFSGRKMA